MIQANIRALAVRRGFKRSPKTTKGEHHSIKLDQQESGENWLVISRKKGLELLNVPDRQKACCGECDQQKSAYNWIVFGEDQDE